MNDGASRAVVTVGVGRGFVVEGERCRFVVTAAHCLPFFPPCISFSCSEERSYKSLLGPLGEEPTVWAECLFVDPISDLAVLGGVDAQELFDEADAYEALTEASATLRISGVSDCDLSDRALTSESAWLLSLDGKWFRCGVGACGGPLWIVDASEGIVGGMSGSPILADDGSAIGVVVCSVEGIDQVHTEGGPNPRLTHNLPGWFMRSEMAHRIAPRRYATA